MPPLTRPAPASPSRSQPPPAQAEPRVGDVDFARAALERTLQARFYFWRWVGAVPLGPALRQAAELLW